MLLDTCTFLWIAQGAPQLSAEARRMFEDPDNEVFLSSVSAWEIAVKHALGRLPLPESPESYVPKLRKLHGIDSLPLEEEAILHLSRLPPLSRDPFDRALVCQALVGGFLILSPDPDIARYPVRVAW